MNGLKAAREQCKMTIQEVADKLGVSKQIVSAWEKGIKNIPDERKKQLSDIFGIPVNSLGEISEDSAKILGNIDSELAIEMSDYCNNEKSEMMQSSISRVAVYTIFYKIREEKYKQKMLEKKIHRTFENSNAPTVSAQLKHIERVNKLYGHFSEVVKLLNKYDACDRLIHYERILEFLLAIELELGGKTNEIVSDKESCILDISQNGINRARKAYSESIGESKKVANEELGKVAIQFAKILEKYRNDKEYSKDIDPTDVLKEYMIDNMLFF